MKWLKENLRILSSEIMSRVSLEEHYAADYATNNAIWIDDWVGDNEVSLITVDIVGMKIKVLEGAKNNIIETYSCVKSIS